MAQNQTSDSQTLSRMSILERSLLVAETERNTLSEALRIVSSAGKVDPVKEGQLEARELAGEAQFEAGHGN